jgi:hypothetical protein
VPSISKNVDFKDPIHKKVPFMVILVPGRDKIIKVRKFFEKKRL